MADHGGCRVGNVDRAPVAGPCRLDCLHRELVREYRDLRALDVEQRKLELEAARWSELDEGAAFAASRPTVTFRSFLEQRRGERERSEVLTSAE